MTRDTKPDHVEPAPTAHERGASMLFRRLDGLRGHAPTQSSAPIASQTESDSIATEIARKHRIKNDDAEQDIKLKKQVLRRLFIFLAAETAVIFAFALFQAIGWPFDFHLDELSFRILIGATIAQVNGMLFIAVRYLFPVKKGK